ncbi:hypothetical protein STEG23_026077 [Scotinomys teguina]
MEVKAAALRCQLLLILLMSAVMLLPGTNGSLLLVQRTVTRTIVLQETMGKGDAVQLLAPTSGATTVCNSSSRSATLFCHLFICSINMSEQALNRKEIHGDSDIGQVQLAKPVI